MPNYRRRHIAGGTYFFTVVTENRRPILSTDLARRILHETIAECLRDRPFDLVAIVLLADHLHAIWTLPADDTDYSGRWARIKALFTRNWLQHGGEEQDPGFSRLRHRRRGVWQRKFWEHHIRDARDFEKHLDYIHYNPVKHRVATCPHDYPYSTFRKWVARSVHEPNWCCGCDGRIAKPLSFEGLNETAME